MKSIKDKLETIIAVIGYGSMIGYESVTGEVKVKYYSCSTP